MDLRGLVLRSLSADNAARREAEGVLGQYEGQAGFSVSLLQTVSALSAPGVSAEDVAVRQSMAVLFKNVIKRRWSASETADNNVLIPQGERDTIKAHLVELMCSTPPEVQKMLAEAVSIIAKHDFPGKWQGLLQQLVTKLATQDLSIVKGVMMTTNSIMKRFRHVYKTDPLMLELIFCLEQFREPLTHCLTSNFALIESLGTVAAANKPALCLAMETHRLINRIFFSLNWLDLPEYFEDNMTTWMGEFAKVLSYKNPLLVDDGEDNEPGLIEQVQAAVVDNISLYATKYEEEFSPYLGTFTQLVWQRLMEISVQPKFDVLATSLIKYLTSVCSKEMNKQLFTDAILTEIVSNIVVRNLTATELDEELFEDNPTDYIRKDMEGSDQDTRRRCAVELVRGLQKFFGEKVSQLCIGYIGSMLETYRTTQDWRAKDAALHLVLAVSVKATVNQAATEINPYINVLDIFSTHVMPEVQDPNVNARPIVKADAIKMLCLFRQLFPREMLLSLLPLVIAHLASTQVVVQTYAAVCIDKFLSIKDKPAGAGGVGAGGGLAGAAANGAQQSVQRITDEDLAPVLQQLLAGLFSVLDNPNLPENDYVMKAIMRTLAVSGTRVGPFTQLVLHKLTVVLERVCKNPVNPHFNHYLFESISLLVRSSCSATQQPDMAEALCNEFERLLFPPFQSVLQLDVTEFTPYVFQVFALLLSFRPPPAGSNAALVASASASAASPAYKALFPPLLSPVLWERRGNVPALSDLFRAYIGKAMADVLAGQHLMGVLGVFQKLLASKATDVFAFKLLDNLIQHCPMAALAPYAPQIFNLLLVRMQEERTPRFCKMFIHSMCLYAAVDAAFVYRTVEAIEAGLLRTLVTKVWAQHGGHCAGGERAEVGRMLVGATKLLTATDAANQADVWGAALKFALALMSAARQQEALLSRDLLVADEDAAAAEAREFDSTYSRLAYAQFPDLAEGVAGGVDVASAPQFFASSLEALCRSRPGQYGPVLAQVLDAAEADVLKSALAACGISGLL